MDLESTFGFGTDFNIAIVGKVVICVMLAGVRFSLTRMPTKGFRLLFGKVLLVTMK